MSFSPELRRLFAQTRIQVLPEDYYIVHLPLDARPIPGEWYRPATTRFAVFIRAAKGITLIVARRKWLRMKNLFERFELSQPMRIISLEMSLSLETHGYLAPIVGTLAESKISIVPVAAFDRDHIVVKKDDLPRAVRVLREFLAEFRK